MRKDYPDKDWLCLVGLIHDLGKILAHSLFGNEPQWAVVGDTFVVGCEFSDKICFYKYFEYNPDYEHKIYGTKYGIYRPNCGLNNLHLSWGKYFYKNITILIIYVYIDVLRYDYNKFILLIHRP